MRELKFRAWDKRLKKWAMDNVVSVQNSLKDRITIGCELDTNIPEVDEEEQIHVMQYTGLKDKHGKDIFEGDLLNMPNDDFEPLEVFFENGEFRVRHCTGNGYLSGDGLYVYSLEGELVGNIYENPELLK